MSNQRLLVLAKDCRGISQYANLLVRRAGKKRSHDADAAAPGEVIQLKSPTATS